MQRGRGIVRVGSGSRGVHRDVKERRRAAALRRAERRPTAAARRPAGQFLLLLLGRASIHARLAAAAVFVLAAHAKGELRRLANDSPRRAPRVAGSR